MIIDNNETDSEVSDGGVRNYGRPAYSRCGHYIFAHVVSSFFFLLSIFLFSFPRLNQPSQIGCVPYLTHGVVLVRI